VAGICQPTKPKHPNPPASPRNPHTHPPHNTNTPPLPKSKTTHPSPPIRNTEPHKTPSPVHTVAPPQPQTATEPRPDNSPPVDFTVHMEVEKNPGFDYAFTEIPKRKENIFESQLREIDDAILYQPKDTPPNMTLPILTKTQPHQTPHTILGDITNSENQKPVGPKTQGVKKSWKKLARAHVVTEDTPLEPTHLKRTSSYLEDIDPNEECLKKQCGGTTRIILAEAVMQPRQAP
jgi:hypothetical protein